MKARLFALLCSVLTLSAAEAVRDPLAPKGKIHIPIGIPNTVDALKTFVEAEGNFSPGFGTYGIYFWLEDEHQKIVAPTLEGISSEHGLAPSGLLIPWSKWTWNNLEVKSELGQVEVPSPAGTVQIVAARASIKNSAQENRSVKFWLALRSVGPAGGPIHELRIPLESADLLEVDGHPAIVSETPPSQRTVVLPPTVASVAEKDPSHQSGGLRYDFVLAPGEERTLKFKFPVLPGRRAVGHKWDGVSTWAQFDLNKPNPATGGILQPDPGVDFYHQLKTDDLFAQATNYWQNFVGQVKLDLPDPQWVEAFSAIVEHSAICMNEGAPDVAVVNYNVFNRDGVYIANILQKAGQFQLAAQAIDYFLSHPFNGRVQCEADNPGQILWIMGEHWKFTHDRQWLQRVYPSARKIAGMIRYYRTTPGPHYVSPVSLDFGDALARDPARQELKPGACDGFHPEYTEAFDLAGLRGAITLAQATGNTADAEQWTDLARELFQKYDGKFGAHLPRGYGSYSVLWPCRLYPLEQGRGYDQFKVTGAQRPTSWRYFPLALAHQGLLAGNRAASSETLQIHLQHPQMQGWYAFDEGGDSGTGGWNNVLTTWRQGKASDAMPHGWAMAEFQLLLRDSLAFEDTNTLVLLAGVPTDWFTKRIRVENFPTHFGKCSFSLLPQEGTTLFQSSAVDGQLRLRLPGMWDAFLPGGKVIGRLPNGDVPVPAATAISLRRAKP